MSLDKAIEHKKERRKQYEGCKAIDPTCRNHGSCDWCLGDRLYSSLRKTEAMNDALDEWRSYEQETGKEKS